MWTKQWHGGGEHFINSKAPLRISGKDLQQDVAGTRCDVASKFSVLLSKQCRSVGFAWRVVMDHNSLRKKRQDTKLSGNEIASIWMPHFPQNSPPLHRL
jgi:hypothetical protein